MTGMRRVTRPGAAPKMDVQIVGLGWIAELHRAPTRGLDPAHGGHHLVTPAC